MNRSLFFYVAIFFAIVSAICLVAEGGRLSETDVSVLRLPSNFAKAAEAASLSTTDYIKAVDKNCDNGLTGACQVMQQIMAFNAATKEDL